MHGIATAAGCQLVAACDLVVAADSATFATPGVKIGLFCSTPMVPISRAVGRKRALEMLLTGEPISAQTALEWGLVNRVVPPDRLDDEVDALVAAVTRYSPTVVGIGKAAFYHQIDLGRAGCVRVHEGRDDPQRRHGRRTRGHRRLSRQASPRVAQGRLSPARPDARAAAAPTEALALRRASLAFDPYPGSTLRSWVSTPAAPTCVGRASDAFLGKRPPEWTG